MGLKYLVTAFVRFFVWEIVPWNCAIAGDTQELAELAVSQLEHHLPLCSTQVEVG
jgi:hypothetical protein